MIINCCHVAVGVEFLVTKLEYLLFDELKYIQYTYIFLIFLVVVVTYVVPKICERRLKGTS